MTPDPKTVEALVEIITREVLLAMVEREQKPADIPEGGACRFACAEGMCVKTCYDRTGQVISAGADRLTSSLGIIPEDVNLAKTIDHTLLKPDATPDQIAQLCFEARKHGFASVCINPTWVKLCAELLQGSDVKVCTVIGFPLGATPPEVKVYEAQNALDHGATEIDMVLNIGALKARDLELVAKDIRGVVITAHNRSALTKVIIETSLLTDEEKVIACLLAKEAGADFVKTSTGFSGGGATVADVTLMRRTVGPEMGVKASGGVRTFEDADSMIKAGATRIGASAGVKIVQGPSTMEKPAELKPAAAGKNY
jgi:deoxyribose-phosphate aldolase